MFRSFKFASTISSTAYRSGTSALNIIRAASRKAKAALCDLKKGRDISEVYLPLCVSNSNLQAIRYFKTGKFDPSWYYNNVSPLQISGIYSNVNTLMK